MSELDFFCYSLYVQNERNYESNWAFVIFKVHYGEWISKSLRAEAIPKNPTREYLDWLYKHFEQNLDTLKASNLEKRVGQCRHIRYQPFPHLHWLITIFSLLSL